MNRRRWCLAIHRQTDYNLMSTSPRVRMRQVGVDHLSAQGSSIVRKDSQLYSKDRSIFAKHHLIHLHKLNICQHREPG